MDIREYIASGILEGYVLGTLSSNEKKEVECLSQIYPEIKEELVILQTTLENYTLKNAKVPHPTMKNRILQKIKNTPQEKEKLISMPSSNEKSKNRVVPYILISAAASIIVIFVFAFLYSNEKEKELTAMKSKMEKMKDEYLTLDANIISMNDLNLKLVSELNMFRNPDFKTVFLHEKKVPANGSLGIICWNHSNKQILLALDNMPTLPDGKQYQLWAMVDGKPMDMGMLPVDMSNSFRLLDSTVENPQSFAITIENKGGSPTPTLEEMYLVGNL